MLQPLGAVYLFRCHLDLAEIWARQFCEPEIATRAPRLDRYEFAICRPCAPLRGLPP